jgi:hypothetical protein
MDLAGKLCKLRYRVLGSLASPGVNPVELAIGKLRQGNLAATIRYTVGQEQAKFRGGDSAFLDSILVLNRPF